MPVGRGHLAAATSAPLGYDLVAIAEGPAPRSHLELGRENPLRRSYFRCSGGSIGRRQGRTPCSSIKLRIANAPTNRIGAFVNTPDTGRTGDVDLR
jgi:hypothetical protein